MYNVSAIRGALKDWLQVPTDDVPSRPNWIKSKPLGIEPSCFLLQHREAMVDLLQLDASTTESLLKNSTKVCNAHLQFLAFHQPILRLPFDHAIKFIETLVEFVDPTSFLGNGIIDTFAWFRFDLICRWVEFDETERKQQFDAFMELFAFNCMANVQLVCAFHHPLICGNTLAIGRILDVFCSRSF
jgi:hypothetical protein